MKKDILIVEDSSSRIKLIAQHFDNFIGKAFDIATSSQQAIVFLKQHFYHCILLDHDLEIEHYEDASSSEGTGQDVCRYIVENKIEIPYIIIHSLNSIGRERMLHIFQDNGYEALSRPFFWDCRYGKLGYKIFTE